MILLDIDENKVIAFAMVPYTPDENVIQMSAGVPGDHDKLKMIPQLQIMDRNTMKVLESAMLTPGELEKFIYEGMAVLRGIDGATDSVDGFFEAYRAKVRKRAAQAQGG